MTTYAGKIIASWKPNKHTTFEVRSDGTIIFMREGKVLLGRFYQPGTESSYFVAQGGGIYDMCGKWLGMDILHLNT